MKTIIMRHFSLENHE